MDGVRPLVLCSLKTVLEPWGSSVDMSCFSKSLDGNAKVLEPASKERDGKRTKEASRKFKKNRQKNGSIYNVCAGSTKAVRIQNWHSPVRHQWMPWCLASLIEKKEKTCPVGANSNVAMCLKTNHKTSSIPVFNRSKQEKPVSARPQFLQHCLSIKN